MVRACVCEYANLSDVKEFVAPLIVVDGERFPPPRPSHDTQGRRERGSGVRGALRDIRMP